MDDIYQDQIIDHYQNPRHFSDLEDASVSVSEANASCGDTIQFSIKMIDDHLQHATFRGEGCAISTAAASLLLEKINKDKPTITQLKHIDEQDMIELLGIEISPTRIKCAMLPVRALRKALTIYEK